MKFKINMHILYHLNWRLFCFKVQLAVHSILIFVILIIAIALRLPSEAKKTFLSSLKKAILSK